MLLLELPPEIIIHILAHFLGSAFFRENIRRITISRHWYQLVWPILVSEFELTASDLREYTKNEGIVKDTQPFVTAVKVSLAGFQDINPYARRGTPSRDGNTFTALVNDWTKELHSSLSNLARILQKSPRARSLSLIAHPENPLVRQSLAQRGGYLAGKPLADLLSVTQLTSLHIDTAGAYLRRDIENSGIHLCSYINALLPSLQSLHCRIDCICEKVFELPAEHVPLPLRDLVISLSLSHSSENNTSYQYAKRCQSEFVLSVTQFKDLMEQRAVALSQRLNNPQRVRVVWHELPNLRTTAFDAVTGRKLELHGLWDSDEGVVEESETSDETSDESEIEMDDDGGFWFDNQ